MLGVCALAALPAAACLDTKTTLCAEGHVCPEGRICDPAGPGCIHPSQATVCLEEPNDVFCTPDHSAALHVCVAEICRPSTCGDGVLDPREGAGEVCDDGNTEAGDGCRADCQGTEVCGDGLADPEAGEVCDDGNLNDSDQCTQLCDRVRCGDGLLSGLETCDAGDGTNSDVLPDTCRTDCTLPACDDDVVDTPDRTGCWFEAGDTEVILSPSGVLAADLDGDQLDDAFVWSYDYERFEVYLSTGDGTFLEAPTSPHNVQAGVYNLAVADLDGDGDMDVVITREQSPSLQIFLGDGTGALTAHATAGHPGRLLENLLVGDFDGDQVPDLAGLHETDCEIDVIYGLGDGTFDNANVHSAGAGPPSCYSEAIGAADLNADGHLDVVVAAAERGIYVMAGDGAGEIVSPAVFVKPLVEEVSIRDLAVADLDGDSLPDILYAAQLPPQSPVRILLNQGSFAFTESPSSPLPLGLSSLRLDAGDWDGDGIADVAVVDYFAAVVFLIHHIGGGTFQALTPPPEGMAVNADNVAFGRFFDHGSGGLALLRIAEHRVVYWSFDP